MDWSRAKTILIVLLACVNAFLLISYIGQENSVRENETAVRHDVCDILAAQGIEVSEDTIPLDSVTLSPAEIEEASGFSETAKAFLGDVKSSETPDGTVFEGKDGSLLVKGSSFSLVYESGKPVAGKESAVSLASSVAEKLNVPARSENFEIIDDGGAYNIKVPQSLSGVEVFNCAINMSISPSGSVIAHGKAIGGGKFSTLPEKTQKTSALMLAFADIIRASGKTGIKIERVEPGYTAKSAAASIVPLAPTLAIATDCGDFYLDMTSGTEIKS